MNGFPDYTVYLVTSHSKKSTNYINSKSINDENHIISRLYTSVNKLQISKFLYKYYYIHVYDFSAAASVSPLDGATTCKTKLEITAEGVVELVEGNHIRLAHYYFST